MSGVCYPLDRTTNAYFLNTGGYLGCKGEPEDRSVSSTLYQDSILILEFANKLGPAPCVPTKASGFLTILAVAMTGTISTRSLAAEIEGQDSE